MSDLAAGFAQGVGGSFPQALSRTQDRQQAQQGIDLERQKFQHQVEQDPTPEDLKTQRSLANRKAIAETNRAEALAAPDVLAAEVAGLKGGFNLQASEGDPEAISLRRDEMRARAITARSDAILHQYQASPEALKRNDEMAKLSISKARSELTGAELDNRVKQVAAERAAVDADIRTATAIRDLVKSGLQIDEQKIRNRIATFEGSDKMLKLREQTSQAQLNSIISGDETARMNVAIHRLSVLDELSGAKISRELIRDHALDVARIAGQTFIDTQDPQAAAEAGQALEKIWNAKDVIESSGLKDQRLIEAYGKALAETGDVLKISSADNNRPNMLKDAAAKLQAIMHSIGGGYSAKTTLTKPEEPPRSADRIDLVNPMGGLKPVERTALNASIAAHVAPNQPYNPSVKMPITALSDPETSRDIADSYFNKTRGSTVIALNDRVVQFPPNEHPEKSPAGEAERRFDYLFSPRGNSKWKDAWDDLQKHGLSANPSTEDVRKIKRTWVKLATRQFKMTDDDMANAVADIFTAMHNPFTSDYRSEPKPKK